MKARISSSFACENWLIFVCENQEEEIITVIFFISIWKIYEKRNQWYLNMVKIKYLHHSSKTKKLHAMLNQTKKNALISMNIKVRSEYLYGEQSPEFQARDKASSNTKKTSSTKLLSSMTLFNLRSSTISTVFRRLSAFVWEQWSIYIIRTNFSKLSDLYCCVYAQMFICSANDSWFQKKSRPKKANRAFMSYMRKIINNEDNYRLYAFKSWKISMESS